MLDRLLTILDVPNRAEMRFGGVSPEEVGLPENLTLHPDAAEYLETCIPIYEGKHEHPNWCGISQFEMYWKNDLLLAADSFASDPTRLLARHGFVPLGNRDGDQFAIDVVTAEFYEFDHTIGYFEDGFTIIYGPGKSTRFAPTRENLCNTAGKHGTIDHVIEDALSSQSQG